MELTHRFTVPTGIEETWAYFEDIAGLAGCFPGAQVTSVEDDTFAGSVKVKLGPIALVYNGSGSFVEKDDAAHRFVVDAKGKDKRGNGTAGAKVTLSMHDSAGSTDVEVITDLAITGKPAQFGRGVMQDVSDKLLGQFVACLEQRLSGPSKAPPDDSEGAVTSEAPAVTPPPTPVADTPAAAPRPATAPRPAASTPQPVSTSSTREGDALDLGATVLPVLAKLYWKQALAAVMLLIVLLIVLLVTL